MQYIVVTNYPYEGSNLDFFDSLEKAEEWIKSRENDFKYGLCHVSYIIKGEIVK